MTHSPAAAAKSVTALSPVTPWHVDWTPTTCALSRGFTNRELPDMVTIERFGPTDTFQLTLGSKELAAYQQGQRIWIHYKPGERSPVFGAMPGKSTNGKALLLISSTSLDPTFGDKQTFENTNANPLKVTPEREAEIKQIAVEFGSRMVVFETGSLGKGLAALRKCTDNLVESWGLKPEQQSRLSARLKPRSSPAYWLTGSDYPIAMRAGGKQALVNFRLTVDETGKPIACEIQRSYNEKAFDDLTCEALMRRGRFEPARDEHGQPVASYYLNTVRFTMMQ
jgi:TonB family protein